MAENTKAKSEKKINPKNLAALLIVICGNIILYLTVWMLQSYDQIYFDQILFQLKTTTQGVQGGIAIGGVLEVGGLTLLTTLIDVLIYMLLSGKFRVKLWKSKKYSKYCSSKACRLFIKRILTVSLGVFLACVMVFITQLDVFAYVHTISTESDFISEHYVDPENVNLTFPEKKRNLIYIFLESMENTFADPTSCENVPVDLIPELTALADENISFSNTEGVGGALAFAGTTWTAAAMVSQTSGVTVKVPIGADVYGSEEDFMPGVYSLGEILRKNGYNQTLIVGSDAEFHGRRAYFTQNGNYEIVDTVSLKEDGRLDEDYHEWWGFEDEKLFSFAKEELIRLSAEDKPFNLTLLTVDTHFPDGYECRLCGDEYDNQYARVLSCSSRQVAEFIEWIKAQPFYEDTTIILSGDHLTMDSEFLEGISEEYVRTTYNCFINPAVEPVREKERLFGTFDMFPTTLAAMGVKIDGDRLALGTNLFSDEETLTEMYGFEVLDGELQYRSEYYNEELLEMEE